MDTFRERVSVMKKRLSKASAWGTLAIGISIFLGMPSEASSNIAAAGGQPPSMSLVALLVVLVLCGWGGRWLQLHHPAFLPSLTSAPFSSPTLPLYHIEVQPDDGAVHADAETIELRMDSTLSLTLRPAERVLRPVALRCYLRRSGELRPWDVQPVRTPAGTFHLRGPVAEFRDLLPGYTELIFMVGSPEKVFAHTLEARLASSLPLPEGVQAIRFRLHIVPSG